MLPSKSQETERTVKPITIAPVELAPRAIPVFWMAIGTCSDIPARLYGFAHAYGSRVPRALSQAAMETAGDPVQAATERVVSLSATGALARLDERTQGGIDPGLIAASLPLACVSVTCVAALEGSLWR